MSLPVDPDHAQRTLLALLLQAQPQDPVAELAAVRQAIADGDRSPIVLRRAAWLCALSGDTGGAELGLRQARLAKGDNGEAWFATALLCLARDDAHGAREAFVAAARARVPSGDRRRRLRAALRAYDPGQNRFAGLQILNGVFDSTFDCFLLLRLVRPEEHQAYELCVARACLQLGYTSATMAILEHDRALNGDTIWYHAHKGHFDWLAERRDAADRHYRRAREIAVRDRLTPFHSNCGILVWLTAAEAERLLTGPPVRRQSPLAIESSVNFGVPPPEKAEIVFTVGCDGNYFLFLPKFLLSVLRACHASGMGRQVAVHCHLADARPGQVAFLEWAAAWLRSMQPAVKLSFGTSQSAHRQPGYYTCLRFLALQEVMDWYGTGVLALDIDCELDPDFFRHLDLIRRHDVGLRMFSFSLQTKRQVSDQPWSIGAHPTYIARTPTGKRFAAFLIAYIEAAYDATLVSNWTIDQCAIARAYDLLLRPSVEGDAGRATVMNFAVHPAIARLPEAGKLEFLNEDGGVTVDNFAALAAEYLLDQAATIDPLMAGQAAQ
jgi:hypothetical protein